jgi:hypothetical protein
MFSGHGSDGSFRGKVYNDFFSKELDCSLYDDMDSEQVAECAKKLETLLAAHPTEAWDDKGWRSDVPSSELGYSGVTNQELRDLAKLFRAASEQHLKLVAWY